jgi:two-component system NtrC family sensor kinase
MKSMENIRVLLVDDEDDFRQTVAKRLIKRGINAKQAASGEDCLNALENETADVVVLDVKMPGMDGIETLHHIKKGHPKTEVIMLTGHATTQDGVDGIKSGAFDYLSKPIELEHLLGKIRQAHEKLIREEERQRETAFRTRMEQQMIATERLASLGTLAAGVAHEINNPLAIIKESAGWMASILGKKELSEIPRRGDLELALGKIEKGVERARRITLQLLESVKQTDSLLSEVYLKELVGETADLIGKEAATKDIHISLDIGPDVKPIWTDPYKLRQVLINLLTNAVYAAGRGGAVTVIIRSTQGGITMTVQDTGQGIPRENLGRIFEPFFSTKPPGEGTGLGLFVTRSIIEKLGGEIEVKSELGKGAAFQVRLPLHPVIDDTPNAANDSGVVNHVFETIELNNPS